ncbi:MAG TPA: hypothetical protein VH142_04500 [Polyangiaceae bacterium]|nr:hypothetical protein [Polyangiaceae bacterium]
MARLVWLALLITATGIAGCGAATTEGRRPPSPANEQTIRGVRVKERPPKLIAPPPAYGNKIVMAAAPALEVVN